jgi:hypothetical protein
MRKTTIETETNDQKFIDLGLSGDGCVREANRQISDATVRVRFLTMMMMMMTNDFSRARR